MTNINRFSELSDDEKEKVQDSNYMYSLNASEGKYKLTFGINAESFLLELPTKKRIIGTAADLVENSEHLKQLPSADMVRSWMLYNLNIVWKTLKKNIPANENISEKLILEYGNFKVNGN